ncbi:hypothetical protein [Bradyrhizobium sp. CCGUVB23]|uniref:hypothetical protein n=1 Tax=Bradyrhizobium sp. CCGUVB23 TaxID=2949630 RepID=UPI0020B3D555|nr:hypothetical protein [Bradyrhizobium sp. CCGUVB23]MCP3468411.1 hypothetical protein [Bradyrhizobium sp. CCGUVB23]
MPVLFLGWQKLKLPLRPARSRKLSVALSLFQSPAHQLFGSLPSGACNSTLGKVLEEDSERQGTAYGDPRLQFWLGQPSLKSFELLRPAKRENVTVPED